MNITQTTDIASLPLVVPLWPTAGTLFGLGRDSAYRLARAGRFPVPVLQLGRKLVVTRASLAAVLDPNAQPPQARERYAVPTDPLTPALRTAPDLQG